MAPLPRSSGPGDDFYYPHSPASFAGLRNNEHTLIATPIKVARPLGPSPLAMMDRPSSVQPDGRHPAGLRMPMLKPPLLRPASAESAHTTVSAPGGIGPLRISTNNLNSLRKPREAPFAAKLEPSSPEEPASVIHKPEGFEDFFVSHSGKLRGKEGMPADGDKSSRSSSSSLSEKPLSASTLSDSPSAMEKRHGMHKMVTPSADFSVASSLAPTERKVSKIRIASLEDIQEQTDSETDRSRASSSHANQAAGPGATQDVSKLKIALSECWTLCNTLDSLSSAHRSRMFAGQSAGDAPKQAWKACWKLCQELYEGWNRGEASQVSSTLELCREFCKCLFGARKRADDVSDSILRVSFELNNHLYNTTDRNLPNVFRERTLDFYLTMCHRMMKQHTSLPPEADALLRSCWSLAEMLFSLRQSLREGKMPDEDLMSSAVQSCWDLCDMFREGWSKVRPDRSTPKPVTRSGNDWSESNSNSTTSSAGYESPQSPTASGSSSAMSTNSVTHVVGFPPDTPTTINLSEQSDSADDSLPGQILVLGHGRRMSDQSSFASISSNNSRPSRVARNPEQPTLMTRNLVRVAQPQPHFGNVRNGSITGSTVSGPAMSVAHTTASAPTRSHAPDMDDITLVKMLVVRAAFNGGYSKTHRSQTPTVTNRPSLDKTAGAAIHLTTMSLTAFVLTLPVGAFGMEPWQSKLLSNYKHAARSTQLFHNLPFDRRAYVTHVIRAVKALSAKDASLNWLNALFEWVMGFPTNKALPVGLASAFISTVENECPPAG